MNISLHNNLMMSGMYNNMNIVTGNKASKSEKLSSGYRINRAADDAAGLAISQKMRNLIRGLDQGTVNAQHGVSWVQIGDGALDEVHSMLNRMTELAIKSLNDTNSPQDRMFMQEEFEQLQTEIDRVSDTTTFNTKNIFVNHEDTYSQICGGVTYDDMYPHQVVIGHNDLQITYKKTPESAPETVSIEVPRGKYNTQQLVDEIDTALENAGLLEKGINFEFTSNNKCNVNLEDGAEIVSVSGGLSYLLNKYYEGGTMGALIGTTEFPSESSLLTISAGNNDTLKFTIEDLDGGETEKTLKLPEGKYTKQDIIDRLNNLLTDTTVKATAYDLGIKLGSDDSIITGFKGNMFKIDTGDKVYTSVFYDNVKFGQIELTPAKLQGGYVLTNDPRDEEHSVYRINSTNNKLTFQPNKDTVATTITIPDGEYTVEEMAAKLNDLFAASGLELKAEAKDNVSHKGLNIISKVEGTASNIGVDTSSSAYATLFTKKVYGEFKKDSVTTTGSGNAYAYAYGRPTFGTTINLTIEEDVNDAFRVELTNLSDNVKNSYTIKLDAGVYTTKKALFDNIQSKINSNPALKDRIYVNSSSSSIYLKSFDDADVNIITMTDEPGNNFYAENLATVSYSNSTTALAATITTNTPIPDSVTFTSSNNIFRVYENGTKTENIRNVTFTAGKTYTRDEIIDEINSQLGELIRTKDFGRASNSGSQYSTSTALVSGTSTPKTVNHSNVGITTEKQGKVGEIDKDIPAKITLSNAANKTTNITSENNQLSITINGTNKNIILTNGIYSRAGLVSELQSKIDTAFGTGFGSAIVSEDNGVISFSARHYTEIEGEQGQDTSIECSTDTSSFLRYVEADRTSATVLTGSDKYKVNSTINIRNDSNTFSLYVGGSKAENKISVSIPAGSYTSSSLVSAINSKLSAHNVTASLDNGYLRFTTDDKGTDQKIYFNSDADNETKRFSAAVFNGLTPSTMYTTVSGYAMNDTINIDSSTNEFNISVDGVMKNLTLKNGSYTKSTFVTMLNDVLKSENIPITASVYNSDELRFTHNIKGATRSIALDYSTAGNSIKAIYSDLSFEKVNASVNADNELVLSKSNGAGTLYVTSSSNGSIFQSRVASGESKPYSSPSGKTFNGLRSRALTFPLTINQYNNEFTFNYNSNSTNTPVSVSMPEGTYGDMDTLVRQLQEEIDNKLGDNKVAVVNEGSNLYIKPVCPGYSYAVNNFSGEFYDKVLNSFVEKTETVSVSNVSGTQAASDAFTVGRRDINNIPTKIKYGVNDELSIDYTINKSNGSSVKETFSMVLDPGIYDSTSLIAELNSKLSEALDNKGYPNDMIKAQVGGVSTGVVGADDANALVFKLNKGLDYDAEGEYIIDGVSGNAAFSIFYRTDGEISVAYSVGSQELTEMVSIGPDETEFGFDYDGKPYDITIPEGDYEPEDLMRIINEKLDAKGSPAHVELDEEGKMKIYASKFGTHIIDNVRGSARKKVFFKENSAYEEQNDIWIQVSGAKGDGLYIKRPSVNTASLGINTVNISETKYANKALDRIKKASARVSEIRSDFGATQNRIEHVIANNENKIENTTAAESKIADADMAKESMELAKLSILEQVGTSLYAQMKQDSERVLSLLQ